MPDGDDGFSIGSAIRHPLTLGSHSHSFIFAQTDLHTLVCSDILNLHTLNNIVQTMCMYKSYMHKPVCAGQFAQVNKKVSVVQ